MLSHYSMEVVSPDPIAKKKARPSSAVPMLRDKAPLTPYKLREGSKLPSRYRDSEPESPVLKNRSPVKLKTPIKLKQTSNLPARRVLIKQEDVAIPHQAASTSSIPHVEIFKEFQENNMIEESKANIALLNEEEEHLTRHPFRERKQNTRGTRENGTARESAGLNRLQRFLTLHKSRRWAICEFFYSAIDEQLFLGDNEFSQILSESFPNLKTKMLNKQQWRTIRRLLGKPRRCSPQFFDEERQALELRRNKIRAIYDGTYVTNPNFDFSDLPQLLPRPLVVGMRVFARIHSPKNGIYGGTIDAVLKDGYRIIFDQEDMVPPLEMPDSQVMLNGRLEMFALSYFLEQTSAKLPFPVGPSATQQNERRQDVVALSHHNKMVKKNQSSPAVNDKVGNFPVRMLVILVKMSKLIVLKRKYVKQLSELNAEAERVNLLSDVYHPTFKQKYASVVMDLEALNKQMNIYLQGIQEYNSQLIPQLSEINRAGRPESIRKVSHNNAVQIVKHCNSELNVTNGKALDLVTALTSLLLQVRILGQQKLTPVDMQTLAESISEIRGMVCPKNAAWFQDHVEVHMKQIHSMMLRRGAISNK